jgi:hypothetical protein
MASDEALLPVHRPPESPRVSLDLVDIYAQLRREAATNIEPPPVLTLSTFSTRVELAQQISEGLALVNDRTPISLETKDERVKSRERQRKLASLARHGFSPAPSTPTRQAKRGNGVPADWFKENTKPILRDPTVPQPPEPSFSPNSRQRLHKLFEEAKQSGVLDFEPYRILVKPIQFQSYLPMVMASTTIELLDGDDSDDTTCKIPNMRCLWDTGAHFPTITEDVLAPSFLKQIRSEEYAATYGGGPDNPVVQVAIALQFSNSNHTLEGIAIVRPAGSLQNGFSGMILGQHSLLNSIEYHVVPAQVLRAKGVDAQGSWGEIRLLGHVFDEEYKSL